MHRVVGYGVVSEHGSRLTSCTVGPNTRDPLAKKELPNGQPDPTTATKHTQTTFEDKGSGALAPDSYIIQETYWFQPGRYFRIWALDDVEIHGKHFILIDNKNKEGQGVLVRSLNNKEEQRLFKDSNSVHNVLALRRSKASETPRLSRTQSEVSSQKGSGTDASTQSVPTPRFNEVHIEQNSLQDVRTNTYIYLMHAYNIPYVKYKCEDCGMLDKRALRHLRLEFLKRRIDDWDLEEDIKKAYSDPQ